MSRQLQMFIVPGRLIGNSPRAIAKRFASPRFRCDPRSPDADVGHRQHLAYKNPEGYLEYGIQHEGRTRHTPVGHPSEGAPVELRLEALHPDSRYYYRFRYRPVGDNQPFWQAVLRTGEMSVSAEAAGSGATPGEGGRVLCQGLDWCLRRWRCVSRRVSGTFRLLCRIVK